MSIAGVTDLDKAVATFENYDLAVRGKYEKIMTAPNREQLMDALKDDERQALTDYIDLVTSIHAMVRNRIQNAHSKTLVFTAPAQTSKDDASLDRSVNKRPAM